MEDDNSTPITSTANVDDLIQPEKDIIQYRDFRGIKNQIKIHGDEAVKRTDNSEKSIKKTFNQYMLTLQQQEEERKKHKEEWLKQLKQSNTFYTDF